MSIGLLIAAAALGIALWVAVMYAWWRKEQQASQQPAAAVAEIYAAAGVRLGRRGWYRCMMYLRALAAWGNRKAQKAFFALFPSAEPAFAKHDALAGLKHGPTSYFLRSISEKESAPKRTTRKIFS